METTDLVAAVTLQEMECGLRVASRLGRYLPNSISEHKPDITSLMFALRWLLDDQAKGSLDEPSVIMYDPRTRYFLSEGDVLQYHESDAERFVKVLTVQPTGQLVFHSIELHTE